MTRTKPFIPKSWFGYQVRDTEAYLRKIEESQRLEYDAVEAQLKTQRSINDQLKTEIEELKRHETDSISIDVSSYEETALLYERLERSVEAIERQGEAERESLLRLRERKRERHARLMTEWDKQFDEYRIALDFLLEEAASWIAKVMEKRGFSGQMAQEIEQAMKAPSVVDAAVYDHDELISEDSGSNLAEGAGQTAKILKFRLRSALKEAGVVDDEVAASFSSMTADGMTWNEPDEQIVALDTNTKRNNPSTFWGELDAYLDEHEPKFVPELQTADINESDLSVEVNAVIAEPMEEVVPEPIGRESADQPVQGSPGLSDEIQSIKNRYIVGKAAGENLYTTDGRLIISKGQTITSQIVQEAEHQGKLPDLIVQMVIPGFGSVES